jgi:hypothetical protein
MSAQSVLRLATGWTTDGSGFQSREGLEFVSTHRLDRLRAPASFVSNA